MPTLVNVGDVVAGKYRVEKVLGVGGMGMVLAAMHLELEQRVAIKLMLPEMMRSPQHVERFLREAKNAVKLRNEHICRVLDVGKLDDGTPYIVMEFMEGCDLSEVLAARGVLPVAEAVEYVLQAIEGIAEAHANHIVHRDLKPQNLFVMTDSDGSPLIKVLDFGISKSSVGGGATKTGDIMGSPSYMAPEQMMSAKDVDGRADVWALGVILYQALTGRLPFESESLPVLCMSVINDQPLPPIFHRRDLPPAFNAVIMRCLEKSVQQRFPNVAALAKALVPFGQPDATSIAERVSKMLSRANSPVVTPTHNAFASTVVGTTLDARYAPSEYAAGKPFGAVSTLQASAGSIEAFGPPSSSKRRTLLFGLGSALVVAGVISAAVIFSRGNEEHRTPAAAPAEPPAAGARSNPAIGNQSETPATSASAATETPDSHLPSAPPEAIEMGSGTAQAPELPSGSSGSTAASANQGPASTPREAPAPTVSSTTVSNSSANANKRTTKRKVAASGTKSETKKTTSSTTTSPATTPPAYDPLSRRTRDGN